MRLRSLVVIALFVAACATFAAPGHHASAGDPPPTCTDPRQGGQTYPATKFLTTPGTLTGTAGRDVLVGSTGDDVIKGLGGDDLICSNGGNDRIDAGKGNDVVDAISYWPAPGVAQVYGGDGNDWMDVHGDGHGGNGNDFLSGNLGTFWGDAGNDELNINTGVAAYGGTGSDTIYAIGTLLGDGGTGNDVLVGQYNVTVLRGGSGNDTLTNHTPDLSIKSLDGGSGKDTCTPLNAPFRSCEILT